MRQKTKQIEVDYFDSPSLVIKDNIKENGDVVCSVHALSRDEKVEASKPVPSQDNYFMTDTRVPSVDLDNKFDIMSKTAVAIGKVESLQQMYERFKNQKEEKDEN